MDFPAPLAAGTLVRRYKRFFADVMLDDGRAITAHCPNPGSMMGLAREGAKVWVSRSDAPNRKLAHTLEIVEADGALVGVNTLLPNRIVEEALRAGAIPELTGYDNLRREVGYGEKSRVDFLLEHPGRPPCYLEVKSVTLSRQPGLAEFPDSVSARAAGHLQELAAVRAAGARAVVLFLVQRMDCTAFAPAADIDPRFALVLVNAEALGIEILVYQCVLGLTAVRLDRKMDSRIPQA